MALNLILIISACDVSQSHRPKGVETGDGGVVFVAHLLLLLFSSSLFAHRHHSHTHIHEERRLALRVYTHM